MQSEKKQEFASRVTGANRSELVVIIYEIILENIEESKKAILTEDKVTIANEMKQARGMLNHLMASLDYQYPISTELMALYIYSDKRLSKASNGHDIASLSDVEMVMKKLKKDFLEVAKQDHSEPVMKNTETIYAGLTYGKQSLNESVDYGNTKRGFQV